MFKAIIFIESPIVACRSLLGLPVLIRTIYTLVEKKITQIILVGPDGGVIKPLLEKHGLDRYVVQKESQSSDEEGLTLSANYHYDPDLIFWMIQHEVTDYEEAFTKVPERWWQSLDIKNESLASAESKTFLNIRKKTKGWIAPLLNKPISFWLTRRLVKMSITPNQITSVNLLIALMAAFLIVLPQYHWRFVGALLMQFSSIVDGCDGEVAGLKFLRSKFGAWFDTVADDFANNIFFVGLFVGLFVSTKDALFLNVGWIVFLFSLGVTAIIYHQLINESSSAQAADFKPAWEGPSAKESSWFEKIRPLMKRDFFILVLCLVIVFDQRIWFFWINSIAIVSTFLVYLVSFIYSFVKGKKRDLSAEG